MLINSGKSLYRGLPFLRKEILVLKKIFRQLHLWLGLISGIVVFLLAVTGCIYVFEQEIQNWTRKDLIYIDSDKSRALPISQLKEKVEEYIGPEKEISFVNIYKNPDKAWVFYLYKKKEGGITYFQTIDYYQSVFVDPYKGTIIGKIDEETSFFNIIKMLHWSLLLKTEIGQPIIGWSTFVFVILLITGIVLWWPRNFRKAKNLFWIKWKKRTSFFRKLLDLHNVLGIYSAFIALVIALTGMVWAFRWFMGIVYVIASGTITPPDLSRPESIVNQTSIESGIDKTFTDVQNRYADAAGLRVYLPKDSLESISVYIQQKEGVYYESHQAYYDQYTGERLKERVHNDKNSGEKLITANYDIHTGAILGLPGKIIVFLASLFCATLPVTGFLMWREKKRKRRK